MSVSLEKLEQQKSKIKMRIKIRNESKSGRKSKIRIAHLSAVGAS
jgi:hypothetical protein